MRHSPALLVCLAFLFSLSSVHGNERELEMADFQVVKRELAEGNIRVNLPAEKMLALCKAVRARNHGRFTEYRIDWIPDYHGLTIIAKDGLLKSASLYDCTSGKTFFDELTADDAKKLQFRIENAAVPFERSVGRSGWERSRKRDWERRHAEARVPNRRV